MTIKFPNAVFATLTLTIEMAAKQRAFHAYILKAMFVNEGDDPEIYKSILADVNQLAKEEEKLIRAVVLQFAEVDHTDLLNGTFEV